MVNPYNKNLTTAFKTLSKNVEGNPLAQEALAMVRQHIARKTPKTKEKTAKTYGIKESDVVSQSQLFLSGEKTPRSLNILQLVTGIGSAGRSVQVLKRELGVCEADINYFRTWGYVEVQKSA